MRKKAILSIILLFIIITISVKYKYNQNKSTELSYAVKQYVTTGFFNRYKLIDAKNLKVSFSDGNMAIVNITGMQKKAPHRTETYKLSLEKNKKGVWKVTKFYPSAS